MMLLRQVLIFLGAVALVASQNSTNDLEVRVTLLENDVSNLKDDVEEVETDNNLQDERLNTMELILNENGNDIDDLVASVDTLQEEMAILRATNTLLLQRITDLETVINTTSETVEEHDVDIQDANIRLTAVDEDLVAQQAQIQAVEQSDTEQDDRILVLEDDVGTWDDRIVVLEETDRDIQGRLVTLEKTILTPWVACVSSPCNNEGSCIDVNVDTFICACRDGYYGETCQYSPFEACSSSPCENDATCVEVNVDTFICLCRDGFFGITCGESYAGTSFLASFDYHPGTPGDPIVFNVALLNPGGHYDVTTSIYTIPIFHGVSLEGTYDEPNLHVTTLLSLTAGQQVWLSPANLEGMRGFDGSDYESWFAGHLVHAL